MELAGCFDIVSAQLSGGNHEGEIIVIDMVAMTKDTQAWVAGGARKSL